MTTKTASGVASGIPGRPQLSTHEAEQMVKEHYGLEGTAANLPSDRDQNFKITAEDGQKYVLKISNCSADQQHLLRQEEAMSVGSKAGLSVQTVVPSSSGKRLITILDSRTGEHAVRMVTYLEGYPIAEAKPQSNALLGQLGRLLGSLDNALSELEFSDDQHDFGWDIRRSGDLIRKHLAEIDDETLSAKVRNMLEVFETSAAPLLDALPAQVIHNDANDYNVVVTMKNGVHQLSGLLDFGDLYHSVRIGEVAIACAYAMLDKSDPIGAACAVTSGYHSVNPLTEREVEALFPLIVGRLGVSVCVASYQTKLEPENAYLAISQKPIRALIDQLASVHPRMAWYRLRAACEWTPFPGEASLVSWLQSHRADMCSVMHCDSYHVLDFSVGSTEWSTRELLESGLGAEKVFHILDEQKADTGIGRYNEARLVYTTDQYETASGDHRTIHIGLDLFQRAGSAVFAPYKAIVHSVRDNDEPKDYGPTVILKHEPEDGPPFFTLYGHLSRASIKELSVGQVINTAEQFATLGDPTENGGWAPHLHFQILGDHFDSDGNYPGVASPTERHVWTSVCPDPNLICGISLDNFPDPDPPKEEILNVRKAHVGPSLSVSYSNPLHIVRGYMQHLYDVEGRRYLDCVNNVPHVGHSNPRVVAASVRQQRTLTTNTRYLHQNLARYAKRLTATMPDSLAVAYFVNSGSEANDLALRIARHNTSATDTVVVDGAYHGNLSSLIELSPYKYDGKGGSGAPETTHAATMPDVFRGPHSGPEAGALYAQDVENIIEQLREDGRKANFIAESSLSCGGQIFFPDGYLRRVYEAIRTQGGVCIADEVQVGMGRIGSHFWGFEAEGVVPDIVTVGKPVGNGHPLGVVVTTREMADSFANGMEYFNTFGGNPVSCAVGLAVLDEIEERNLQQHALKTGRYFVDQLRTLAERHPIIGDVRGRGLFLGFELVRDRTSLEPADSEASYIVNRMKDCGILLSTDGPLHNVIKIKPPLVFTRADVDQVVANLDVVLTEDPISTR